MIVSFSEQPCLATSKPFMSVEQSSKVQRYCPECGKRVAAPAEVLKDPQICPACKTRVYFLEYPKEPLPAFVEAEAEIQKRDPSIDRKLVILIIAGVIAALLFGLVALITGQLTLFFIVGLLAFTGGIVAVALALDGKSKELALKAAFTESQNRLRYREECQTRLVHTLQGFKKNFDTLAADERASLQQFNQSLLREAEEDRAKAGELLAGAVEKSGAASAMCQRLLTEVRKNIKAKLTPNNFATQKARFHDLVAFCEKKGYPVEKEIVEEFDRQLKEDYEEAVRKQLAKEEQARIKERIRDELRAERELEKELQRIEAEENAIKKALEEAMARTHDEHSAEVQLLREKLAEAEARAERAKSMAQQTKAGNVYVISNIGSFGSDVFKIGMTRRLEPMDRVKELGDASVPFPFDVHMMLTSDDAPALEARLHREFTKRRLNRVNLRKEFFRVSIAEIAEVVRQARGEVEYEATPEALEYHESLSMTDEDLEFISSTVDPESFSED